MQVKQGFDIRMANTAGVYGFTMIRALKVRSV